MTTSSADNQPIEGEKERANHYVVVARRYRPQVFEELIGQEHVAQALCNAISGARVGHAYLFTGARGVGKTSAARIFAKALNCEKGPSPTPCNECDICRSISAGEDVDVLEIDGASNRGIDEIRQLRQNVNIRPSRSRFKIYIIDEVHMLTREAFNALLKTLEEPPEHVKFIFCTTEPTKIPITILSRCQRYDFSGILTASIVRRLQQIAEAEGVLADAEALEVLARRAAGSMRDSQSLLEQLLSFSSEKITVADVNELLGTAGDPLMVGLVQRIVGRDAAGALADLDAAILGGVDPMLLVEQLFGYFRDCMCSAAGCTAESFIYVSPAKAEEIANAGKKLGLQTVLAMMQILDQTLSRMRYSLWGRVLAELSLVRMCSLEDLDELPALIAELRQGIASEKTPSPSISAPRPAIAAGIGAKAGKKNFEAEPAPPVKVPEASAEVGASPPFSAENLVELWNRAISRLSGMVVEHARHFEHIAFCEPDRLVISFKPMYAVAKTFCERSDQVSRLKQALAEVSGRDIQLDFTVAQGELESDLASASPKLVS
ncbi:MAG: DNA polymerase III subunit gamma/tau, partial [Thermoguttaceae bacterium]